MATPGDAAFGNDAQRELFGKNFASIIALLRRDLSNIEVTENFAQLWVLVPLALFLRFVD